MIAFSLFLISIERPSLTLELSIQNRRFFSLVIGIIVDEHSDKEIFEHINRVKSGECTF
jgi:hypothetical protein